jgi:hypothetical protein
MATVRLDTCWKTIITQDQAGKQGRTLLGLGPPIRVGFVPSRGIGFVPSGGIGFVPSRGIGFVPSGGIGFVPSRGIWLLSVAALGGTRCGISKKNG